MARRKTQRETGEPTGPKTLSFADVNEFVHDPRQQFEHLQGLCLELATALEKAEQAFNDVIEKSVSDAPTRFVDGGIEVQHFGAKVFAASFKDSLGDAKNYVSVEVGVPPDRYDVTVRRITGQTPAERADIACKERDKIKAALSRLLAACRDVLSGSSDGECVIKPRRLSEFRAAVLEARETVGC